MQSENLLELLETYADIIERQDHIINSLSQIVKKQAVDLEHHRSINQFIPDDPPDTDLNAESEIMEYRKLKEELNNG